MKVLCKLIRRDGFYKKAKRMYRYPRCILVAIGLNSTNLFNLLKSIFLKNCMFVDVFDFRTDHGAIMDHGITNFRLEKGYLKIGPIST